MTGLPDQALLARYGTDDVWQAKLAGLLPPAAALALPILAYAVMRASQRGSAEQRQNIERGDARERAIEALRASGANAGLRGQGPLPMYPADASIPDFGDGQDLFGAGKLAALAGRRLAKQAGIGTALSAIGGVGKKLVGALPGIGRGSWKGQALTGALALGGGVAALKGTRSLLNNAGAPAHTMVQGYGPALPQYVNTWGQPVIDH